MKICLIRPPKLMVKDSIPIDAHAPIGMALVASVLRQEGHEVIAIDCIGENPAQINPADIELKIKNQKTTFDLVTMGLAKGDILNRIPADIDIIGISSMFSLNWPADRDLISFLGSHFPKAIFIAGGESTTGMSEVCLRQSPALKVCVLGEGEETVVDLIQAIETGRALDTVKGIAFKADSDKIIVTDKRNRLRNLDDIPRPAWDLFPLENYARYTVIKGEQLRRTLPILATRGCPYECTFCTSPDMWGTRYFMRNPAKVVEEIEWLYQSFGITNFEFYDLTAIIRKNWIIEFARLLIDKQLNITWKIPAGTRSEAIDAEVAMYLKKSGCFFITYAPESGSERMLHLIKKKVNLENMLQSMQYSHQEGMITFINMILGLPDETHKDIWKTLRFLTKCARVGVNDLALAIFRPYPGSVLFERLILENKIDFESDDYFAESLLIIDTGSTGTIFNSNISPMSYKLYHIAAYVAFYGAGYVYKPVSFFRAIKNIANNRTNSLFEHKIAFGLRKWKEKAIQKAQKLVTVRKSEIYVSKD